MNQITVTPEDLAQESTDSLVKVLRGIELGIADCENFVDADSDTDRRRFWEKRQQILDLLKERRLLSAR